MSIPRPPILSHCLTPPPPGFPPPDYSPIPRLSTATWRTFVKNSRVRSPRKSVSFGARGYGFLGVPRKQPVNQEKSISLELVSRRSLNFYDMGVFRKGEVSLSEEFFGGKPSFQTQAAGGFCPRGYTCLVEAVVSTTDAEDVVEEVEELLAEIRKEERKERELQLRRRAVADKGTGIRKFNALRKRQAKIECESWELAAQEYKELIEDMCAQKLAPNLPYMKS